MLHLFYRLYRLFKRNLVILHSEIFDVAFSIAIIRQYTHYQHLISVITQEQLKALQDRCAALKRYLDIDGKRIEVEEEELRTHVPDFWNDQKAAEAQMRKVKSIKFWIEGYEEVEKLVDEVVLGFDFVKEELITEDELDKLYENSIDKVEKLELRNMLRQEEDKMDVVLKINAVPRLRTGLRCLCACICAGLNATATRLPSLTS